MFFLGSLLMGCQSREDGPMAKPVVVVGYHTVEAGDVQIWREMAGRVKASREADVRPQVDGIIKELGFTEGAEVTMGQPLYRLEADVYLAERDQAAAALKSAEASLTAARLKSERNQQLLAQKSISRQDADDALAAFENAAAVVEEKAALLETARINLERTEIRAPISGRIGLSSVTVGQLVNANQAEPLATIRVLDPIFVDIARPSENGAWPGAAARNSRLGDERARARLTLEDGSDYGYECDLLLPEPVVDESTGAMTFRAVFPNLDEILLPGMFVRARISQPVQKSVVAIKQQAVTRSATEAGHVMLLTPRNEVERRSVVLGPSSGDKWIVFEGLKPGERVIVEGLAKVRPGDMVEAVEEGLAGAEKPGLASAMAQE